MDIKNAKSLKLLFIGLLCFCHPVISYSQSFSEDVSAPELRKEILEMAQKDQDVQEEIMRKAQSGETVDASDWARKDSVFLRHIDRAKEIIDEHQWPGYGLVGEDGSQGFFLIVQHADADTAFQKKALVHLKEAFKKKQASGEHVAFLTDRVLVAEGRPQVYGTQFDYDENACPVPGNIDNQEEVDIRRAKVGLIPLDEYLADAILYMGKAEICSIE